jgi:uncharacterized repeat protein (TIGR01451 family)
VPTATSAPVCESIPFPTLTLTAFPAQALPGTEAAYTLLVSNPHTVDITQVTVSTSLSNLAQYVSATASQGQPVFQGDSNSVSLAIGTLVPGQTVQLVVRVRLSAEAPASSPVTASASAAVNGVTCIQASATVIVTPAGIPVTGGGPGWHEIRVMLLAGLSLAAGTLWAGRLVVRKRFARR